MPCLSKVISFTARSGLKLPKCSGAGRRAVNATTDSTICSRNVNIPMLQKLITIGLSTRRVFLLLISFAALITHFPQVFRLHRAIAACNDDNKWAEISAAVGVDVGRCQTRYEADKKNDKLGMYEHM